MSRLIAHCVLIGGVVACVACNVGDPLPTGIVLDHIDINNIPPTLAVGDSVQLNATGYVTGSILALFSYDRLPDAVWSVSDTSMAQLTPVVLAPGDTTDVSSAWVRGKRAGTVNVTVSARRVSSTAPLNIVGP